MRLVRIAATQPGFLPVPDPHNCLSSSFRPQIERIHREVVLPQLAITERLLEEAAHAGCDVALTTENITGTAHYFPDLEHETYPQLVRYGQGEVEERLSRIARKHSMYVIACYNRAACGQLFNSCTVFDRKGRSCARYDKLQLPAEERWWNQPGERIGVFDLDFGRIGLCICYDVMFEEIVSVLGLQGAEIVFHPTAGYGWYDAIGEATLRTRANDASVHLVVSKNYQFGGAGRSGVIDYWGQYRADAGLGKNAVALCTLDLDEPKLQPPWYNPSVTSGQPNWRLRKAAERRPELYAPLAQPLAAPRWEAPDPQAVVEQMKKGLCRW